MKNIKKVLIIAVMTLLYLEFTLQVGSLILNYQFNQSITNGQKGKDQGRIRVLCVGDSFTQGVGATVAGNSYPMQMQGFLNEAKGPLQWKVVNCGKAGTYSSELASYLPKLLEEYSPRYLCILIGVNDSWNPKDSVVQAKAVVSWKARFRTKLLIQMLVKYAQDIKRLRETEIAKGPISVLEVSSKAGVVDSEIVWSKGYSLYSSGKFNEAREALQDLVSRFPQCARIVEGKIFLSNALAELKRMEEACEYALSAREQILNNSSQFHNHLAWLFLSLNKFEYAYQEIEQYEKFSPEDKLNIFKLKGNYFFETYAYNKAEDYFNKALEVDRNDVFVLRTLARIYSFHAEKLADAKRYLMKAYALDKNKQKTALFMGIVDSSAPNFPDILRDVRIYADVDKDSAREFLEMSEAFQKRKGGAEILKKNLAEILSLCATYHVIPVFMTYPAAFEINAAIHEFCSQQPVLLVDSEKIFTELLKTGTFEQFFVKDAHLNDVGYKILGKELARVLYDDMTRNQ